MTTFAIGLDQIDALTGGRLGTFDTTCPRCSYLRHSAKNRSAKVLRVWRREPGFASYCCAHCGESGYTFDRGGTPPAPAKIAKAKAESAKRASINEQDRLAFVERLWAASGPIAGTPGADYLTGRAIQLDDVPDDGGLRWHPHCPWEDGAKPCIVARYTDAVTGKPRGLHRRPITGEKPKTLGPAAGSVIRLWPDEDVAQGLVLGEGLETVLAAATRVTCRGTLLRPAWAAGGTANMASFPVLAGIESLTLLVDHDVSGAGERAAAQCAQRWRDAGCEVIRLTPVTIGDFNDLVREVRG